MHICTIYFFLQKIKQGQNMLIFSLARCCMYVCSKNFSKANSPRFHWNISRMPVWFPGLNLKVKKFKQEKRWKIEMHFHHQPLIGTGLVCQCSRKCWAVQLSLLFPCSDTVRRKHPLWLWSHPAYNTHRNSRSFILSPPGRDAASRVVGRGCPMRSNTLRQ